MLKRLLTGIVIIAVTIGFFALRFVSPYIFDLFIGCIAVFATLEVCSAFEKNKRQNDKYIIATYPVIIFITLLLSIHFNLGELLYFALILGEALILIGVMYVINLLSKKSINRYIVDNGIESSVESFISKKVVLNIFLLFYPAFLLSLMFFLNHIAEFAYFGGNNNVLIGMMFLMMLFATTMFTDTGAYLIGSGIRGKKLCPKISPNKTISGAVGGLFSGIMASLLLFVILNFIPSYAEIFATNNLSIWLFLIYGIFASIVTQFGDIFASLIKRKNNIKDYGNIFPGHGGFMDRMDGIAFNLIITTIFAFIMFI